MRGKEHGAPLANGTLNKERATLSLLFQHARRQRWVTGNPVRETETLKQRRHRPVILDANQYERLLEVCGEGSQLWLYALLLGETGLRDRKEALALCWEEIDLGAGFLRVRASKTEAGERWVPLTPRLREALARHAALRRNGSPWVFCHEVTRGVGKVRVTARAPRSRAFARVLSSVSRGVPGSRRRGAPTTSGTGV